MKLRIDPCMYARSPASTISPAIPSTSRAVCATAGDPHSPMSPTAINVAVWEGGGGEGASGVRGVSLHPTARDKATPAARIPIERVFTGSILRCRATAGLRIVILA